MTRLALILAVATALAGCVTTHQTPRYLIVRDNYELAGPGAIDQAIASLPATIAGTALYAGGGEPSMVPRGGLVRHVQRCRIVDRDTGQWQSMHCPDVDALLGGEVGMEDRNRHWRFPETSQSISTVNGIDACSRP